MKKWAEELFQEIKFSLHNECGTEAFKPIQQKKLNYSGMERRNQVGND